MEVLMLFGYKAEFKAEMQRRADENIRQFKASRIPKKTNWKIIYSNIKC